DPALEAILVRAAGGGRDAVDVGLDPLRRLLGPGERALEVQPVLLLGEREQLAPERAVADDPGEERLEAVVVMIDRLGVGRLVAEDDREATVQVGLGLEALGDDLRVEADVGEDLGIGPEGDRRAAAARRADLPERARRLAAREGLLPLEAVALDARRELLGERG